jgi:hypothetical protein
MSASAKFQNTLHQLSKIETKERLFLKFFFFKKIFIFFFILFYFIFSRVPILIPVLVPLGGSGKNLIP